MSIGEKRVCIEGVPQDFRMKWRPHCFQEFWNFQQSRTLHKLDRQMRGGILPQLSIFCGTYSAGKTSAAYVLGMWSSCCNWKSNTPCGACYGCQLVQKVSGDRARGGFIELDGTSATIADELQEIVSLTRDASKKDIFEVFNQEVTWKDDRPYIVVVDEAHRMSPKTQESLLKLAERLSTAKLVLITTEQKKIDGGLYSRGAVYWFRIPTPSQATQHILRIAEAEGIHLAPESAAWIAERHNGKPRECLGALWDLRGVEGTIDSAMAKELLADDQDVVNEIENEDDGL